MDWRLGKNGERGRNRTYNLLIKSTCGTRNQHFSAVWIHSDSLVKMRGSVARPNLQPNASKRPLGTILGTVLIEAAARMVGFCVLARCRGMMQTYRSHRHACILPARFGQRNAGRRLSVTHGSFLVEFVRSRAEILTGCFLLFNVWIASFLFEFRGETCKLERRTCGFSHPHYSFAPVLPLLMAPRINTNSTKSTTLTTSERRKTACAHTKPKPTKRFH
jgi:hypothetical protein